MVTVSGRRGPSSHDNLFSFQIEELRPKAVCADPRGPRLANVLVTHALTAPGKDDSCSERVARTPSTYEYGAAWCLWPAHDMNLQQRYCTNQLLDTIVHKSIKTTKLRTAVIKSVVVIVRLRKSGGVCHLAPREYLNKDVNPKRSASHRRPRADARAPLTHITARPEKLPDYRMW
ncbi:hypothetical protein EVAR_32170_1 [Eumeta japonica]|uniref:Uncharacterized protein n=1 Tax=Eumeta variegata TaxID=151549 RepID=A0A4C1W0C5_EUMVA|nr:hypothetical protein EVAR_32170_1 [Eumeta japonica]